MDLSSSLGSLGGGSGLGGGPGGKVDPAQRAKLIENVKQQLAMAKAQELLENMNNKCFKLCITKPGSSFSGSEQKCVSSCMERYIEAYNIVAKTYGQRLQKELQAHK